MKKLLLASVIAIASAVSVIAPANAASITFGIGNGYDGDYYAPRYRYHYRDYNDGGYYGRYSVYNDEGYRPRYYGMYHHRCRTEVIRHWRHHHRVIETVRVCGN
ncbi:hypothetical protein FJ546_12685 [Mesorhizobium sp. B2-4-19]|uniref:hypothetical protein n=1 Tax=Mesorhizobium sp. B2-4-19 TaxID=2589930 RepID=UPI00112956C2|nr:hypothetical protein [Mesorhizobium sp. B2-4-19]TPK63586.1 hypothetical protein FJ546_12685 [Mesorhizobium sp. B2-4-19]